MTDTGNDTTTIAVSRDTKSRLDNIGDGTYEDKIRTLLDEYDSTRVVLTVEDDGRVADLIEEHST